MRLSLLFLAVLATSCFGKLAPPPDAYIWPIHPGAVAFRVERSDPAMAIYGVIWQRRQPQLRLRATSAFGHARGREITSKQIERLRDHDTIPVAGVNGDFFVVTGPFAGSSIGSLVSGGELLRFTDNRPVVAALEDGSVRIANIRHQATLKIANRESLALFGINRPLEKGGAVLYSTAWGEALDTSPGAIAVVLKAEHALQADDHQTLTVVRAAATDAPATGSGMLILASLPDDAAPLIALKVGDRVELSINTDPFDHLTDAIGGNAILLQNRESKYKPKPDEPKHPRTAVGYDADDAVLLVVDGRAPGHSVGMTMPELREFMASLGCTDAMNLDGGGSSACYVRGKILNRTSDGQERANGNALALVSEAPLGEPASICLELDNPLLLAPGASVPLKYTLVDARLNPLDTTAAVKTTTTAPLTIADDRLTALQPGRGTIEVIAGRARGSCEVIVTDAIKSLVAQPSTLQFMPAEGQSLRVTGRDAQGREVVLDAAKLHPGAPQGLASGRDGLTFVGAIPGSSGTLQLHYDDLALAVPFEVAKAEPFETFDKPVGVFRSTPDTVTGEVGHVARDGESSATLSWSFDAKSSVAQAAYLTLERKLGRAPALQARVRSAGAPVNVQLKLTITDGNGAKQLFTLYDGPLDGTWRDVRCDVPVGLPQPVKWSNVYVVRTSSKQSAQGTIEIDRLDAWRFHGGADE